MRPCTRTRLPATAITSTEATTTLTFSTRLRTVEELRTTLTSDQFLEYKQPKIDLGTGEVHSVEVSVRWNHPTRRPLHPEAFLGRIEGRQACLLYTSPSPRDG